MRLHKHVHIHKGIWTMLMVRWSHALLALRFIVFLLFIGSDKQYGMILISFRTSIVALFQPHSFSCFFHYISIDYEQSNALLSTGNSCNQPRKCMIISGKQHTMAVPRFPLGIGMASRIDLVHCPRSNHLLSYGIRIGQVELEAGAKQHVH